MKAVFIFFLFIMPTLLFAQPSKKKTLPASPISQKEIDKMMEDAMNGLSTKEKDEIRKGMGQAKQITGQIKQKGVAMGIGYDVVTEVPAKQTVLLSKIPNINSVAEFSSFIAKRIADCKKGLAQATIKEVDDYFVAKANDPALLNISPFLLMQQKPLASVYAALKLVALHPDNILLKNNLGVILHQIGYPEMAIPVFGYILITNKYPEILNNKAQCYLSLGDKENAVKFFTACIAKNADHSSAHAGLGLILASEGNMAEATLHIIKSLKNGYSETAEALAKKHKVHINFSDIKPVIAEYFNPQKYKPVPPATNVNDLEKIDLERNALNEFYQNWQKKSEELSTAQNMQKDSESIFQLTNRNRGYVFKMPLSQKAAFITNLLTEDYTNFLKQNPKQFYVTKAEDLYKDLEGKIELINKQPFVNRFEDCEKKVNALQNYLSLSAANHEAYQRKTLYQLYDWVNQNLLWKRYLLSSNEYKQQMYELITDFFRVINGYKEAQIIYPLPTFIAEQCKGETPPDSTKAMEDSLKVEEEDCPIKIEVPFGVGKAKFNCKGYEIEGGEGIVGGLEKNYKTGEFTIFLGLGFGEYAQGLGIGGIESGAKAGSFVTIGKDWNIVDCGNKAEAGIEGGIGPFITEIKLTGTMGMESGINIDRNVLGTETKIFQYETTN